MGIKLFIKLSVGPSHLLPLCQFTSVNKFSESTPILVTCYHPQNKYSLLYL